MPRLKSSIPPRIHLLPVPREHVLGVIFQSVKKQEVILGQEDLDYIKPGGVGRGSLISL